MDQRLFLSLVKRSRAKSCISAVLGLKAGFESYPNVMTRAFGRNIGMKSRGHIFLLSAVHVLYASPPRPCKTTILQCDQCRSCSWLGLCTQCRRAAFRSQDTIRRVHASLETLPARYSRGMQSVALASRNGTLSADITRLHDFRARCFSENLWHIRLRCAHQNEAGPLKCQAPTCTCKRWDTICPELSGHCGPCFFPTQTDN